MPACYDPKMPPGAAAHDGTMTKNEPAGAVREVWLVLPGMPLRARPLRGAPSPSRTSGGDGHGRPGQFVAVAFRASPRSAPTQRDELHPLNSARLPTWQPPGTVRDRHATRQPRGLPAAAERTVRADPEYDQLLREPVVSHQLQPLSSGRAAGYPVVLLRPGCRSGRF